MHLKGCSRNSNFFFLALEQSQTVLTILPINKSLQHGEGGSGPWIFLPDQYLSSVSWSWGTREWNDAAREILFLGILIKRSARQIEEGPPLSVSVRRTSLPGKSVFRSLPCCGAGPEPRTSSRAPAAGRPTLHVRMPQSSELRAQLLGWMSGG